jgi:hypothetical protein
MIGEDARSFRTGTEIVLEFTVFPFRLAPFGETHVPPETADSVEWLIGTLLGSLFWEVVKRRNTDSEYILLAAYTWHTSTLATFKS